MDQLKDLKAQSDKAFDVQLQKQNLLESCRARQVMAYNGGLFKVNHTLIPFLHTLEETGRSNTIILDSNDNPVEINTTELLQKALERYQEAVNTYHKLYKDIRR